MSKALKAQVLLVLVTFVWGATFVVIKNAVEQDVTPLTFNFIRMTFAAAILAILFRRQLRKITRQSFLAGVVTGVFFCLGFEFQTTGIRLTTASKSAFITGISVVLVPIFLKAFWGRKTTGWTALGVGSATIGLFLLTVPATAGGLSMWASMNPGDLLTLACAVCFAFHIIFLGRSSTRHPFAQIGFLQVATAAVLMGLAAPLLEEPRIVWSQRTIGTFLMVVLLGTAFAFTIQTWAQQFISPTHTALILSLEPVFAWITSYVVLGERLGFRAGTGALLILAGLLVSELRGGIETQVGDL
jgi:drug/metabolite transporter (DMT)-like permease